MLMPIIIPLYNLPFFPYNQERRIKEIVLKAMGQAISKSVAVTEIIKVILFSPSPIFISFGKATIYDKLYLKQKRNAGLHQDTNISSVSITDVWEPIEEGLVA